MNKFAALLVAVGIMAGTIAQPVEAKHNRSHGGWGNNYNNNWNVNRRSFSARRTYNPWFRHDNGRHLGWYKHHRGWNNNNWNNNNWNRNYNYNWYR